jgi:hypothetical protein
MKPGRPPNTRATVTLGIELPPGVLAHARQAADECEIPLARWIAEVVGAFLADRTCSHRELRAVADPAPTVFPHWVHASATRATPATPGRCNRRRPPSRRGDGRRAGLWRPRPGPASRRARVDVGT